MNEREKHNMMKQISVEDREEEQELRKRLYSKKYLSQIIEEEKPEFKSNNLILAPVGSGKSFLIEKTLIPEGYDRKIVYLTSNTALKDSLCPNDNESRKELADKGESVRFFTSGNKSKFGDASYSVHVMTYSEFGGRIHPPNETFTDDVGIIFCDEIHSLPQYIEYDKDYKLGAALRWLLTKHENKQIFFFTATTDSIEKLERRSPGYFNKVSVFNYLEHPEIRQYIANSTYYIRHIDQVRSHLRYRKKAFDYHGYKALAFTKMISEQERIKELAELEGYKPIALWSVNNKEKEMDEEQLKVRDKLLKTGLIPEPYNLLIINGAMQEGWNLYDDKVVLAILDTIDITEQVQALGRIRKDVDFLIKKTDDEKLLMNDFEIPSIYLDKELTKEYKDHLCNELAILTSRGNIRKWPSIKAFAIKAGYEVEDKVTTIDGKTTRVSIIIDPKGITKSD